MVDSYINQYIYIYLIDCSSHELKPILFLNTFPFFLNDVSEFYSKNSNEVGELARY